MKRHPRPCPIPMVTVTYEDGPDFTTVSRVVFNDRAVLEWELRELGFGERLIERVLRLNPDYRMARDAGRSLRGMHLSNERAQMCVMHGCVTRGAFIRLRGREAFERLPREALIRRGRRVYVSRRGALTCLVEGPGR